MTQTRFKTIQAIADRKSPLPAMPAPASIEHYAEDVFNVDVMQQYLSRSVMEKLLDTVKFGHQLDPSIANDVASAMKEWAVSRGATHYTHWFQPLTGGTAEKHDAFLQLDEDGHAIFMLSGKNLILSEPDASSFPSGGLRCTFEARGYTAWDPTSPAFIKRHANGATLCIPSVFCSYTGEVLDRKTPLLRSAQALKKAVARFMKCFNQPEEQVTITLGAEQEYFLIDRKFYLQRPDLVQAGRTVFGAPPSRHQQLDDHYFGAIKPRILNFMSDVENELWRLGIPAKTRHNEVAPAQFEIVPIFEDLNVAVDHNMLVMETLRQVASRHGLICLLHEKPFAGVNGSGKHNNWSVTYGKRNLLDPGSNPRENAIFITFLTAIIRAIDLHGDLLRATTAGLGNDYRLGANEAPPACISIFLGEQLTDVIQQIEAGVSKSTKRASNLRIGVDSLPSLPRDATDRNRTSPFAFTGQKFEFRTPGSRQNCAGVITILNIIAADSLDYICDKLEQFSAEKFNDELQKLLQELIEKHKRIIFNGDNYSKEWHLDAARRGLPILRNTLDAIKPIIAPQNQQLLERYGVFSPSETMSRYEVFHEEYLQKVNIEGGVTMEIARSMLIPAATAEYQKTLNAINAAKLAELTNGQKALLERAKQLGDSLDRLEKGCRKLEIALGGRPPAEIIQAMGLVREAADALELLVEDELWPLPKYREMLFIY